MSRLLWYSIVFLAFSLCFAAKIHTDDANTEGISTKTRIDADKSMDQEDLDEMSTIIDQCNKTYTTELAYWQFLNESGTFPDETFMTPKCFVRCVLMMSRVQSPHDGSFDPGRAAVLFADGSWNITAEELETIANSCADRRQEKNDCERGYGFLKCLMEMEIETTYESNNKSDQNH